MGGLFVYVCHPNFFIKLLYSHLYIFNGLIAFSISPKLCYFCIVLINGMISLFLNLSKELFLRPFRRLPHHIFILYVTSFVDNEQLTN